MSSLFCIFIHVTGEINNATKAIKSTFKFPVQYPPCSVEVINSNFQARYNKQKNIIKVMHWNGGGKHLKHKKDNIETVITSYKPEILGISEPIF